MNYGCLKKFPFFLPNFLYYYFINLIKVYLYIKHKDIEVTEDINKFIKKKSIKLEISKNNFLYKLGKYLVKKDNKNYSDYPCITNLEHIVRSIYEKDFTYKPDLEIEYDTLKHILNSKIIEVNNKDEEFHNHIANLMLRLGLLNDLVKLINRKALLINENYKDCINFTYEAYQEISKEGQQKLKKDKTYVLSTLLWGREFANNFCHYLLSSICANNDIYKFTQQEELIYFITTTKENKQLIQESSSYKKLSKIIYFKFYIIPPELEEKINKIRKNNKTMHYIIYGMLDHISIHFAQTKNANIFLFPPDCILGDTALKEMRKYIEEGFLVGGSGTIIIEEDDFISDSKQKKVDFSKLSSEDLIHLSFENRGKYFYNNVVSKENKNFNLDARELIWLDHKKIYIHSVYFHPIFISSKGLKQYVQKNYSNVDYGVIPRICSKVEEIKVFEKLSDCYIGAYNESLHTKKQKYDRNLFINSHRYAYIIQKQLLKKQQSIKIPHNLQKSSIDREEEIEKISKNWGLIGKLKS